MDNSTSMEKLKAFHSIKSFLSEDQQKEVISMLELSSIDITKRIWGKDNEVEFILMIFLLEWCKDIVGFEEGIASLTKTVASDLLIVLKSGEKIVVEIKSTEKKDFKVSEKLLEQKIEFANKLGAKLFFAIKLMGHWLVFSSDYILANQRKITIEKDLINSELNKVFGDRTFLFPEGLKITSIYSKTVQEHLGITNGEYGNLIKYRIEFGQKSILEVDCGRNENLFLVFVYEFIQDIASNQKQTIQELDLDRTIIIEELTEQMSIMNLSAFILSPIKHLMNMLGNVYDFNQYLTSLIDNNNHLLTRQYILYGISYLAENDYPILEMRGNDLFLFKDMIIKDNN